MIHDSHFQVWFKCQWLVCLSLALALSGHDVEVAGSPVSDEPTVDQILAIARVPAEFPVHFCLLTHKDRQYVAFYDDQRRMTVACRPLDSATWQFQVLPEKVGWDSHNYITIAVDDDGFLHLSGNMHAVPLIYYRTSSPGDIATFERVDSMVGKNEARCTYPVFMRGAKGEFIFHYRDGSSGSGNEIYNVYDHATKTWRRLLDTPLTDGQGLMNAYFDGPNLGPDGFFHLCWVWRDTGDCATNHDLSYARSRDLLHWETVEGTSITLPMTLTTPGLIVDPVPVHGGLINGCAHVGFDSQGRTLVSYHKFDAAGVTQAYVARFENGAWVPHQVSDWSYRWDFQGGGAIIFEITLGRLRVHSAGNLALPFGHAKAGGGEIVIDEETLRPVGTAASPPRYPAAHRNVESDFPGMCVHWAEDVGGSGEAGVRYVLRWETLPQNRDQPRTGTLPGPSELRVVKLRSAQ